jgi:26S proteasome regulatory subunit T5
MSSTQDMEGVSRREPDDGKDQKENDKKGDDGSKDNANTNKDGDAEMKDAEPEEVEEILDEEVLGLSTLDLQTRKRLLENDARIMKSEFQRLSHEKATMGEKIKDNMEKIANNR